MIHNAGLSRKERLTFFDEDEVARVAVVLADDECFKKKAERLANVDPARRADLAYEEARSYAPNKGARHDWIAELLLTVTDERWVAKGISAKDIAANRHRRAVWADTDLEKSDPRRERERWATLDEGARAIARFGAGKCICCNEPFARDSYERGASGKRSRRTHCNPCKAERPAYEIKSQLDAMRKAFDVGTGVRHRRRTAVRAAS